MDPFIVFDVLTILTVAGQVIACAVIVLLVLRLMKMPIGGRVTEWLACHGLLLMLIVAAVATSGSLFFSEIALFAPCKDCWLQRIFMYPQVVLLGIALYRRDRDIAYSILALSVLGIFVSVEHYAEQWAAILDPIAHDPQKPCDLSGISCSAMYIFEYGYITIPLMAMTGFALNILGSTLMILQKKR